MSNPFRPGCQGQVVKAWQATFPEPLVVRAGDIVEVGHMDDEYPGWIWCTAPDGYGGWVPETFFDLLSGGLNGIMNRDYSAQELSVQPGDILSLHDLESGWYWASLEGELAGWLPADHVQILERQETGG